MVICVEWPRWGREGIPGMLHLVVWLGAYMLVLLTLVKAIGSRRERTLFKALFFPGTALAVAVQVAAARLCLGRSFKASLLGDRQPAFSLPKEGLPCLGGALFLLIAQALLYVLFLIGVSKLEGGGFIQAHLVSLPDLYPGRMAEGRIELDLRSYLFGLRLLGAEVLRSPLAWLLVLHTAVGAFAALHLRRREARWAAVGLFVLGAVLWIGEWFGAGFPFLSRGWWASSTFRSWWMLFSLFFTIGLAALGLFTLPGIAARVVRLVAPPKEARKEEPKKEPARPPSGQKARPARVTA